MVWIEGIYMNECYVAAILGFAIVERIYAGFVAWVYRNNRDKDITIPGMLSIKKRPAEEGR